jgi:choline dehydrogenase-like flavoprotein
LIVDLAAGHAEKQSRETDVLILGAGVAGLVLASRLRSMKIRVTVLESGGREQTADTHPLNRAVQLGDAYSGATRGRFRCLGGTSTRWGGALIPFAAGDLAARPHLGLEGFPIGVDAVLPYLAEVERLFQVDEGSYEEQYVHQTSSAKYVPTGDLDFMVRFAKWPPFHRRNLALIFSSLIENDPGLDVWINSTATKFDLDRDNGRITAVTARGEGNSSVVVFAKHVVICAGAIESTRLLLLLDRQYDERLFSSCTALGRFFYDHISTRVADIHAKDVRNLNRIAGFRFEGSAMRSIRFEFSAAAQERERVGSAFAHISFQTEKTTGFDALRDFMRSRQRTGRIRTSLLLDALRDVPYLAKLGLWRFRYKQLLWPTPARYELHLVAEQLPRVDNYIALSSDHDRYGLPIPAIRWTVDKADCKTFTVFKRCFEDYWGRQGLHRIADLDWKYSPNHSLNQFDNSDVYHPGGSTRMGINRRTAVVDPNLQAFDIPNLSVASTSVFPSGGGENPTLMLMLFTMRLADYLGGRL